MTDTQPRWTLKRDAYGPGSHRFETPFAAWSGRLTDAEADDVERALPALNGTPAEDLPPGVVRYDADTLVARGDVVRGLPDDQWDRRLLGYIYWFPTSTASPSDWYEVRRIEQPATVKVPLHQLAGRRLPGCEWAVRSDCHQNEGHRMAFSDTGLRGKSASFTVTEVDGVPMVTVLAENGPQQCSTERGARKAAVSVPKLRELAVHGGSDGVPSVDVCGFCSDSECDGIACIAALDPDDTADHEAIERLHTLLRAGHALLAATEGGAS